MGELSAEETSVGGVDVPERWELDSDGEEEGGGIDKGVGGWAVDVDVVDELAALAGESRLPERTRCYKSEQGTSRDRIGVDVPLGPLSHRAQNARGVLLLEERRSGVALHFAQISSVRTCATQCQLAQVYTRIERSYPSFQHVFAQSSRNIGHGGWRGRQASLR